MIRFLTAGESHGPQLTAILEGIPAGLDLSQADIDTALARRQVGYGSGGRMQIEKDHVRITSGVMNGKTTGAPIALIVENRDFKNWKERDITPITTPRPGHADLTGAVKYGYRAHPTPPLSHPPAPVGRAGGVPPRAAHLPAVPAAHHQRGGLLRHARHLRDPAPRGIAAVGPVAPGVARGGGGGVRAIS